MSPPKVGPDLAERLERAHKDEFIELVVELRPLSAEQAGAASREERIASLREAFQRQAAPVEAAIRGAGGEVLGSAWLNQTLRARVPAESVAPLTKLDEVSLLDLARPLLPE